MVGLEDKLGPYKLITLRNSDLVVKVDPSWYEVLQHTRWRLMNGYAYCFEAGKTIAMHRHIMGSKNPKVLVDHKNGDRLDNRENNLREASALQNMWNRKAGPNRGVTWQSGPRPFVVKIRVNRKELFVGAYATLAEARLARVEAEEEHRGIVMRCAGHDGEDEKKDIDIIKIKTYAARARIRKYKLTNK